MELPLILVTNDDGIGSEGLWATVEALLPLGEVMVVAPDRQWSGGGRSMPPHVTGRIVPSDREVSGERVAAYAVDASPALAVQHGVLELAPRRPALVVSGINVGVNLGTEVTISGTIGAAFEASAFGIPALAVSLEEEATETAAAKAFVQRFACYLLAYALPYDVDVLSINIPSDATPRTMWRLTRLSRHRYFIPQAPDRDRGEGRPTYRRVEDVAHAQEAELDTDVWTVMVERAVSVTPLSLDMTSRVNLRPTAQRFRAGLAECQDWLTSLSMLLPRQVPSSLVS